MNIAFDIDGVIFPIEDFQISEGKKYFKNKEIKNLNGYGIKEVFDCSDEEEVKFWLKNTFKYNKEVIATPGISSLIKKLRNDKHKIYILTSRAKANENSIAGNIMRKVLEDSLKRNNIEVDGIIYTSTSKSDIDKYNAIKKYNIHIMIEDNKENIDKIKDITDTICFTTKNNSDYSDEKVKRALNVDELNKTIYTIIDEFNSSKTSIIDYKELDKMNLEEKKQYFEQLKQTYYSMREPFLLQKNEEECIRIINKLQKIYNFIYRPHVIHSEKFPKENGVILASNHLHALDPLLIMSSEKDRAFHLLAKKELLDNKIWNYLFTTIGSTFVDNKDVESRRKAKEEQIMVVLNGGIDMIFPEGTRNKTDERLLNFHLGALSIAQITGRPIYPFGINSDYRLFKNNLSVAIGDPMYVSYGDNLLEKQEELKQRISLLLDEVEEYETSKRLKLRYPTNKLLGVSQRDRYRW